MVIKNQKIQTQNIGSIINFDDYTPSIPSIFYNNTHKRTHKIGGGIAGLVMHYTGLAMLGGVFVGGIVSGIQGTTSVKGNCEQLNNLSDKINDIQQFQTNELLKRRMDAKMIHSLDFNTIRYKIAETNNLIIQENNKFKDSYKILQIANIVSVSIFIIIIISKVIIARSS